MEWQDDPQDRAPMTEAIEETEKLRARVAELEAELEHEKARYASLQEDFNGRLKPSYDYVDGIAVSVAEDEIDRLRAELENQKQLYAAHIGDEHDNCGVAVNQMLQDEVERLREKCSRVGEYLNLIFIELYGFAGATMHENGLKTLKSLRDFLDDTEGLSDEYIAKELKRNGIDPEALVKRGLAMIEKAKAKAALEVDGD